MTVTCRGAGAPDGQGRVCFFLQRSGFGTRGAQILHRCMALVQQRVKRTEPGRGRVTAFSPMRPGSCNERKCTSLVWSRGTSTRSARRRAKLRDPRSPSPRAPVCPGGGRAPKGLAPPRVGGPRAAGRAPLLLAAAGARGARAPSRVAAATGARHMPSAAPRLEASQAGTGRN